MTALDIYIVAVAGVFGLLIGSFLNACAFRIPQGISIAWGRSFCPSCTTQILAYDNVPVLSWLLLRGKCRACGAPISVRYPLVEGLTGLLFAGVAILDGPSGVLLPHLVFVAALVLVSEIDLAERIIPDVVVLPVAAIGAVAMTVLRPGGSAWWVWIVSGCGAAAFLLLTALGYEWLRKQEGMGMGDVKLGLCMGMFLGSSVIPALFIGFVAGAVAGAIALSRGEGKKTAIPFGPFLSAGAIIALFVGPQLIHLYLRLALHQ